MSDIISHGTPAVYREHIYEMASLAVMQVCVLRPRLRRC
jgi:hypothetical protein